MISASDRSAQRSQLVAPNTKPISASETKFTRAWKLSTLARSIRVAPSNVEPWCHNTSGSEVRNTGNRCSGSAPPSVVMFACASRERGGRRSFQVGIRQSDHTHPSAAAELISPVKIRGERPQVPPREGLTSRSFRRAEFAAKRRAVQGRRGVTGRYHTIAASTSSAGSRNPSLTETPCRPAPPRAACSSPTASSTPTAS